MRIESYAYGNWHIPNGKTKKLYEAATGLEIGMIGTSLDSQKMIYHANFVGGKNLLIAMRASILAREKPTQ